MQEYPDRNESSAQSETSLSKGDMLLAKQLRLAPVAAASEPTNQRLLSTNCAAQWMILAPAVGKVNLAQGVYGPMLNYDSDRVIGELLRKSGSFQETKILEVCDFLTRQHDFQSETFVDIGANIGTHLVFALKEAGFQSGFGIEPDSNNYRLLVCNVLLNGLEARVSLFNLALSDEAGWAELELSPENYGDHRIRSKDTEHVVSFGESERIVCAVPKSHAGEWLAKALPDPSHSLIWIDTQGHEGHIFRCFLGASHCSPPRFVVSEFWPYGLERVGGKDSYLQYLAECDAVYDINVENWSQMPPVTADSFRVQYEKMLAETTAVHYPHTDLLCIRGSAS